MKEEIALLKLEEFAIKKVNVLKLY